MMNLSNGIVSAVMPCVVAAGMLGTAASNAAAFDTSEILRKLKVAVHIGSGGFGVHVRKHEPPRHVHSRHCVHHAGHYEYREERVLVRESCYETVYVPPVYETRCGRHGREYRVLVRDGYHKQVHHPAVYEIRKVKVWVPERWTCHEHGGVAHSRHDSHRGRGGHWRD